MKRRANDIQSTLDLLARFERVTLGHLPTRLEPMPNLGNALGLTLSVKRDDCTGIALGGNKVRQLEYYLGAAKAEGADVVLITGAVQSNFVRTTAAMARQLGMDCHIQLEERVPDVTELHRTNGNVLLSRLLGATLHSYPDGEDEAGADQALAQIADVLRSRGHRPYIIGLGIDSPPLGALGYVRAACEVLEQFGAQGGVDEIVVASGSALTHAGLLVGLRLAGSDLPVRGVCVRRDAASQSIRVQTRIEDTARLLGVDVPTCPDDIRVTDIALGAGYGRMTDETRDAISQTAQSDGLLLDPVYTGKVMASLMKLQSSGALVGPRVLFWHTGGQPALFGYEDALFAR